MDDVERHDHLDGRAVGVSDDPPGTDQGIGGVDLGYDQRYIAVHTEGTGIVDHHGAVLGDGLCVLEGDAPARRDEGYVYISEVIAVLELADGIFLPTEGDLLPSATLRGKEF